MRKTARTSPRLTRREFLSLAGKGLAAAELARLFPGLAAPAHAARAQTMPAAAVSVGDNDSEVSAILDTALAGVGGIERFVKPGQVVVIKPNATWAYPPHTASSTDPELLRLLIRKVKDAGASRIIVMDHCSIDPGTAEAIRVNGIGKVVKEEEVEGLFPDRNNAPKSTYTGIELPAGRAFQQLGVLKTAVEADVRINLAVAKTHNVTRMTMCLKHMMGFLQAPGRLHANLEQGIADLSTPSPVQAHLHILEALRVRLPYGTYRVCAGPETDVTNPKVVQRRDQIVAGTDPLLIDTYGCVTFFDMQPEELPYLQYALESGIGEMDLAAAQEQGRLVILPAGQRIVSTPAAVSSPTSAAAEIRPPGTATPVVVSHDGTATPLPPVFGPVETDLPVGIEVNAAAASTGLIDPRPFLNTALIPAAAVVAGAGLVAAARLRAREDGHDNQGEAPDEE